MRFTITETIGNGNLVHSTFVSDVRIYDEGVGGLSIPDSNRAKGASAPLTDNRIAEWFGTVKGGATEKWLFDAEHGKTAAKHINGYLTDAADVFVESRRKPICTDSGELVFGSMPNDGGHLSDWDDERKNAVVEKYPAAEAMFREFSGAAEFINRRNRWCLWLKGVSPSLIRSVPPVMEAADVWCHSVSGEQIFDKLHPGEDGFANGLAFADADKPKVDRLWIETPDGKVAIELTIKSCGATRMTFAVPAGIASGDYILVAQRMNPDRRSFVRARHKVRIWASGT